MDARQAIRCGLEMAQHIATAYVNDLTDEQLMLRPHPQCNHINWQLGHLIVSENHLIGKVAGYPMPALPDGFAEKYTKETQSSDNPADFATKDELLRLAAEQRAGTLQALERVTDEELDRPTGLDYAPTVGALFSMQGSHWLMHAGQWVIVRRQLGKPPLF
ncbi:MAG: hypothetical protein KatS3mg110_3953 [Pirellulaceae bacterium]|nr:MAG: hypothetical protein KatS3mg110_3953 [Pirellulaceae bacterium]